MTRVILVDPCCPAGYTLASLGRDPLGGTESTVLRVVGALADSCAFTLYQAGRGQAEQDRMVRYLPLPHLADVRLDDCDALIVINAWKVAIKLRKRLPQRRIILWLHNYPGRHNRKMGPALAAAGIEVVCVSRAHAMRLTGFLSTTCAALPDIGYIHNPIADDLQPDATPVDRNRLLFASAPHKGLRQVYESFARLRQAMPELVLEVADPGYQRWDTGRVPDGVRVLGTLRHPDLVDRLRGALCLFYPQTEFAETFGLVIAEANAVGTPALVHAGLGANDEVVSSGGQCMDCGDVEAVAGRIRKWREIRPEVRGREQFRLSIVRQSWDRRLSCAHHDDKEWPKPTTASRQEGDAHVA